MPRTLQEFANIAGGDKKTIAKMFKTLASHLDIQTFTLRPEQLVPRYCSILGITDSVVDACRRTIERATELGVCAGLSPQSICGATICCLSDVIKRPVSTDEVAKAVLCSAKTLKNVGQQLCPYLELCVPEWFKDEVAAVGGTFLRVNTVDWSKPKPAPPTPPVEPILAAS